MPVFHAYVDSHPATPQEPSCRPRRASTPLWSTSIFHHLGKVSLCSVEIGKLWCSKVGHACRGLKAPGNDKGIDVVHNFAWFLLDVSQRQDLRDMLIRDLSPSLSSSSRSSCGGATASSSRRRTRSTATRAPARASPRWTRA